MGGREHSCPSTSWCVYGCRSRKQGIQFDPGSQFKLFCSNYVCLYVSCTIQVENKVSDVYFVTNFFSFFLINPVISMVMLLPLLLIGNSHSAWSPHTMYPLNDDVSHVYTLCLPSIIMALMDTHSSPLNYYGSHGYTLFPPQWWWIQHDKDELVRELPLHKGTTGLVRRWFTGTHEKSQDKTIYHHPCSFLVPPLR